MNNRSRFVPPLAAALLLGAVLALRFLWPVPDGEPPVEKDLSRVKASPVAPVAAPESSPVAAQAVAVKPAPDPEERQGPRATGVPIGPGDEVPEPEVPEAPPQRNEPIEPEQPQTEAWRHGKMVRITELLGRDVERLEQERREAESRGDAEEARRLEVQLKRHRERLGRLREETAALAEAARREEQGTPSATR